MRNEFHHFRVVRFFPHAGHGLIEEVLGDNLSLEDAERVAQENLPVISGEDVVIQDQQKIGLEADVKMFRHRPEEN